MKKMYLFLLSILALMSCTKDDDSRDNDYNDGYYGTKNKEVSIHIDDNPWRLSYNTNECEVGWVATLKNNTKQNITGRIFGVFKNPENGYIKSTTSGKFYLSAGETRQIMGSKGETPEGYPTSFVPCNIILLKNIERLHFTVLNKN